MLLTPIQCVCFLSLDRYQIDNNETTTTTRTTTITIDTCRTRRHFQQSKNETEWQEKKQPLLLLNGSIENQIREKKIHFSLPFKSPAIDQRKSIRKEIWCTYKMISIKTTYVVVVFIMVIGQVVMMMMMCVCEVKRFKKNENYGHFFLY